MTSEKTTSIRDILPISLAVTATYSVGLWGLYLQPQLLIPLMERYGASETEIGTLYGVENFAYFVTLLLTTIPITRYSRTKMALLGTILFVFGSIACAYAGSISTLMVCRIIVSIGGGLISSAGTAAASCAPDPERTFAISGTLYLLGFGFGHALIPDGLENFGLEGIYVSMALFGIAVIPAYSFLYPPVKVHSSDINFLKLLRGAPFRSLAIMAMGGLLIFELGQNAVFTYMDKLGENAGLESQSRGMIFFMGTCVSFMGGAFAAWMGTRYGRFKPLVCGIGLNVVSAAMFAAVKDPDYYPYMMFTWDISYAFALPYIMGTLASLDREGRWAVAGDAFWNFSSTPGPVLAALIVTHAGYNPLAIWVFTSGAVGMTLLCFAAKQSDKLGLER